MKKIISLILMLIIISLCACNTNTDDKQLNDKTELNNINSSFNEIVEDDSESINQENLLVDNTTKNEVDNEALKYSGDVNKQVVKENSNEETSDNLQSVSLQVMTASLSNKKCAWGFVRQKNEVRPQFSANYTKVLDDYEGIYAGNSEQKVIYLTFDEGYENGYTGAILDTLKEKNCPATFFVTKPYVKQNQELVKRMIDEGHIVR